MFGTLAILAAGCAPPDGGVWGRVLDQAGAPIPNARIKLDLPSVADKTQPMEARAGEDGAFMILWAHGKWSSIRIEVSSPGFKTVVAELGIGYSVCEAKLSRDTSPAPSISPCEHRENGP